MSFEMLYFDLFQLPVSFLPDEEALKSRYLQNCKKYHPDFHSLAEPEVQEKVLEMSTLNNLAYQTISDFYKRMKYILQSLDLLEEEEKYELEADFLMEMMEINEALMELEFDFDPGAFQSLSEKIAAMEAEEKSRILQVLENPAVLSPENRAQLNFVKEFYFKHKYILRIREKLNNFAPA